MNMHRNALLCILLLPLLALGQSGYDIIIRNGKIIDGSGNSWYYADIAVKDGRIAAIRRNLSGTAERVIDAKGLLVTPGFIDVHAHIEESIFQKPTADNYIYDGVTTVVTGNCGGSADDLSNFFSRLDSMHHSINIASLVGHNTVRRLVMGEVNRFATAAEQQQMEALVEKAMRAGAVGLSTGLIYLPGMYSNTEEVIGLAKKAAAFNAVYASHIRNEENKVIEAVNEAINIGKLANIPVEISHFKVGGKANWGRSKQTVALIEAARSEGYDVTIDQYPYTGSSTNLGIRLPNWALGGGQDSLKMRILDPAQHKRIIAGMLDQLHSYQFPNYGFAVIAYHKADTSLNGKSISQVNLLKGRKPGAAAEAETILDLMLAGGAQMIYHTMNEDDVRYIMKYPFNMCAADAGVSTGEGVPHPRGYGSNARVLGRYVRDEKLFSWEEAIRRMCSLPAQKFGFKDRGLLKEGMAADILVFDQQSISDMATYEKPHQFSKGFHYVLVNGKLVIDGGTHNGTRSGKLLYGSGVSL